MRMFFILLVVVCVGCSTEPKNDTQHSCSGAECADAGANNGGDSDSGGVTDAGGSNNSDAGASNSSTTDVGSVACGDASCSPGEICVVQQGCPVGPAPAPSCVPTPTGCSGALACDCFADDPCGGGCTPCGSVTGGEVQCACQCRCASPDTPIATPAGEREIATLRVGDLVYSVDGDALVAVPIIRTSRTPAQDHRVVRLSLASGRVVEMSAGHPTGDGRTFGGLSAGDRLGEATVERVAIVDYEHEYTYDILPDSDTGTYVAAGALVGSTLRAARNELASTARR